MRTPLNHLYAYTLDPSEVGTHVTSYYDWSRIAEKYRDRLPFPIIPDTSLKASLGILARTVEKP